MLQELHNKNRANWLKKPLKASDYKESTSKGSTFTKATVGPIQAKVTQTISRYREITKIGTVLL